MAKVRIIFEDKDDGTIHINIDSDEPLPIENEGFPEDISELTRDALREKIRREAPDLYARLFREVTLLNEYQNPQS